MLILKLKLITIVRSYEISAPLNLVAKLVVSIIK